MWECVLCVGVSRERCVCAVRIPWYVVCSACMLRALCCVGCVTCPVCGACVCVCVCVVWRLCCGLVRCVVRGVYMYVYHGLRVVLVLWHVWRMASDVWTFVCYVLRGECVVTCVIGGVCPLCLL